MESFLAAARAVAGQSSAADVSASSSSGFAWVGRAGVGALAVLALSALAFRRSFHRRSEPPVGDETGDSAPAADEPADVTGNTPGDPASGAEAALVTSMLGLHGRVRETTETPAGQRWVNFETEALGEALERFAPEQVRDPVAADLDQLRGQGPEQKALRRRLQDASDGDLVFTLLTLHKLAEEAETDERSRQALAAEGVQMGALLERFAPAALEEGLATYFGDRPADFETKAPEPRVGTSSDDDDPFDIAGLIAGAPIIRSHEQTTREESTMEAGVHAPLIRLCTGLAEATGAGQVEWVAREETSFRYKSSSGGVDVRSRERDGEPPYELILFNSKKERVDTIFSEWSDDNVPAPWNEPLVDLYRAARRRALGVDKIIDDLLGELRAASESHRATQPSGVDALLGQHGLAGQPGDEH